MILALAGVMAMTISCQREILPPDIGDKEGNIKLNLSVRVPGMSEVKTRAVDPDGAGVQNITLFCFDEYGLFVSTVSADVNPNPAQGADYSLSGTFSATVPAHVETVHLIGNQNLTYFQEGNYEGMSEVEVITSIQASAGRMIYWAREDIDNLVDGYTVTLYRNQAKMTVSVASAANFVENGWVVVNTNAFGTVAPYNSETGLFEMPSVTNPFVTKPTDDTKLTKFTDTRISEEEYFFESENTEESPVDLIVKGRQGGGPELYYRISLLDANGDYVMLLRNHHYIVNIAGPLSYGQASFVAALTAPASNNVWVSISDDVPGVYDADNRLAVDETFVVIGSDEFGNPPVRSLFYTVENVDNTAPSEAEVRWMDGNNVARHNFTHNFNSSTGRGQIDIELLDMGNNQKCEGTLLLKYGRLTRKIKVITVKKQEFVPAWITTNVYGGEVGEKVTMMFNIPETCPEELFPLDVLVSVNELDIRNESGMALPVIREGEEGYGADNGIGYKYVHTVTEHGVQRLYMETILNHDIDQEIEVSIEADYFYPLAKTAIIRAEVHNYILLHNLRHYSATIPADDVIYYHLVPMKKGATVAFPIHLGTDITWNSDNTVRTFTPVTPGPNDEFLIYSKYLSQNTSGDYTLNFNFYPVYESYWSTGGRVYGFVRNNTGTPGQGATYNMVTNASRSAEMVRIASNPAGYASVVPGRGTCSGNPYISAVFELNNFHAFNFSAAVNDDGDGTVGLTYMPGTRVDVDFDITSFISTIDSDQDGTPDPQEDQVSVDPFGMSFKVYIDAPMLEIDDSRNSLSASKFYEESDGRFVYVVDADRESERRFGSSSASLVDNADVDYIGNPVTVNQSGERKSLPFRTKGIVSTGDITISSEEEVVVFNKQTFTVMNQPITGNVTYGASNTAVPAGEFLPFEMLPTYNRIGALTVTSNGRYELHMRSEYKYNWYTDKVKIQFVHEGVTYEAEYDSLNELYSSPDIHLTAE